MLILILIIKKYFTAFHTPCPPSQASRTSYHPTLHKKLQRGPGCPPAAGLPTMLHPTTQKPLGNRRDPSHDSVPKNLVFPTPGEAVPRQFLTKSEQPQALCASIFSAWHPRALWRGADGQQAGINAPLGKSHINTSYADTAIKIQQWHLTNGRTPHNHMHTSFKTSTSH